MLFAVAGASQILAGFDGEPTVLQIVLTVLHALVAGGAAGWMALPDVPARRRRRRPEADQPRTSGAWMALSRKSRQNLRRPTATWLPPGDAWPVLPVKRDDSPLKPKANGPPAGDAQKKAKVNWRSNAPKIRLSAVA
ncbi:hypothetical protein [Saccharothrix sp.]|uniref:hypothetical protein n=1 Tax=Saccharothrix sp. TaxID=1873460 RepID=UPI00281113F5|nr:hypothetical protein [Saccharothrix sp.]